MSMIKLLSEQIQPAIDAAREDITIITNVQVLILVRDYIMAEYDFTKPTAGCMAISMTVEVADQSDVEAAADFLCQGFDILVLTIRELVGYLDQEMLLKICRALSIKG